MRRILATLVVVVAVVPAPRAVNTACVESLVLARIKATNPVHQGLIRQGFDRSATFRRIMAEIEVSSWTVFVQTGRCPEETNIACLLHFVGTFEDQPYLRVIVQHEHRHPDNAISSLAHELQHAREVVQSEAVFKAGDIRDLFKRIGRVSVQRPGVVTYETEQAREVEEAVWRELMQPQWHRAAGSS